MGSKKKKQIQALAVWGDSITAVTQEVVPSMSCMGNEILFFPWTVWLRAPGPLLSCCGGLSLSRWTKPNHGGELSVDLWDVWGRVVFPLQRSGGSGDRWKSRQREWILGHKCLAGFFFLPSPSLMGIAWIHFFFPLWKLNEKIREVQSTRFLYAMRVEALVC